MGITKDVLSSVMPYVFLVGAGYLVYRNFFGGSNKDLNPLVNYTLPVVDETTKAYAVALDPKTTVEELYKTILQPIEPKGDIETGLEALGKVAALNLVSPFVVAKATNEALQPSINLLQQTALQIEASKTDPSAFFDQWRAMDLLTSGGFSAALKLQ